MSPRVKSPHYLCDALLPDDTQAHTKSRRPRLFSLLLFMSLRREAQFQLVVLVIKLPSAFMVIILPPAESRIRFNWGLWPKITLN